MRWPISLTLLMVILGSIFLALSTRRNARQIDRRKHVVLVGASIGQAWQLAEWPARMGAAEFTSESIPVWQFDKTPAVEELLLRPRVRFRVAGAYLRSFIEPPRKPDIVIIKECSSYFPGKLELYKSLVRGWVDRFRARGIQVVMATVVPVTRERAARDAAKQEGVLDYNAWVREYAREQGLPTLDLERALRVDDKSAWLRGEFAAPDGSHLIAQTYAVLDRVLLDLLRHLIPASAAVRKAS